MKAEQHPSVEADKAQADLNNEQLEEEDEPKPVAKLNLQNLLMMVKLVKKIILRPVKKIILRPVKKIILKLVR